MRSHASSSPSRTAWSHLTHYENDPQLRDIVILRPDCLATAMSYVLDDEETRKAHGLVKFSRLNHLWDDPTREVDSRYPRTLHPIFLRLMERFDARGRDFYIVTQAETVDPHLALREDLKRLGYASYVVELLDRFTYDEDENTALYRLLADTLARLNNEIDSAMPVRYYEIRLLDQLGYRPQLFRCLQCNSEIQPIDQYISFSQGGVLCPKC